MFTIPISLCSYKAIYKAIKINKQRKRKKKKQNKKIINKTLLTIIYDQEYEK